MENVVITLKEEVKLRVENPLDVNMLFIRTHQKIKDTIGNILERIDADFINKRFAEDKAFKQAVGEVVEKSMHEFEQIAPIMEARGYNYRYADFEISEFDETNSSNMEIKLIFHSQPITVLETFTLTGKQTFLCVEGEEAVRGNKFDNLVCLEISPFKIVSYKRL
jgi:hypothetical protein